MIDKEIFDRITDKVYISDIETYEVLYTNPSTLKVLGADDLGDVKGKKCYEVLQGRKAPCEFCTNHLLKENEFYEWEIYNQLFERSFLNQDTLIDYNGRLCRLEICKDLEKQTELDYFYEKLGNEVLVTALRADDIEEGIRMAIGILGEKMQADRIYIFEIDEEVTNNTYEWCAEGVTAEKDQLQNINNEVMKPWFRMFRSIGEVFIEDLEDVRESFPEIYAYLQPQNISTLVALPIYVRNKLKGFFGVDNIEKSKMKSLSLFMKMMTTYVSDLIEKRDNRYNLERMSKYDSLTGLYNRKMAEDMINATLKINRGTLLIIDLDQFKSVNDIMGHQRGDTLLKEAAMIMKRACRESDIPFRLGGDEFGIFYRSLINEEVIISKCENLVKALQIDVEKDERIVKVSASVGVVVAQNLGDNFVELYAAADQKLYRAKESGKNKFCM